MTENFRRFIGLTLIASLVSTSLPAMSPSLPPSRFPSQSCFKEQALAAPTLIGALVNTVKLFRKLSLGRTGWQLGILSTIYASAAHAATASAETMHTVLNGESLIAISRQVSIPWQEIYSLNKEVIGPDPNLILRGIQLFIPQLTPPPGPSMPTIPVEQIPLFNWAVHLPTETWIIAAAVLTVTLGLLWIYRRAVLRNFPMVFALAAVLSGFAPPVKKAAAPPPPIAQRAQTPSASREATQIPPRETFTKDFFVTPDYSEDQLLMPEKGTVEPKIAVGKTFEANTPVVEIIRDPALYIGDEAEAERDFQQFALRDKRVRNLFETGSFTAQEMDDQNTGFVTTLKKLERARYASRSDLSFPFRGKVLWSHCGLMDEKSPFLTFVNYSHFSLTLPDPKALYPDGRVVHVIPLIQRGFPVSLSVGGKAISYSHFTVKQKTLTFFIHGEHWQEGQGRWVHLSVQAPPFLNSEPAFLVHTKSEYTVLAPADGILKDYLFLERGTSISRGAYSFFSYDTTPVESVLSELKATRDHLIAQTKRTQRLLTIGATTLDAHQLVQIQLAYSEKKIIEMEKEKDALGHLVIEIPWNAIVEGQTAYSLGQRIKKGAPLLILKSRQLESTLHMDTSAVRLKPSETIPVIVEGTQKRFPAIVRGIRSAGGSHGAQHMEMTVELDEEQLKEGFRIRSALPSSTHEGFIEQRAEPTESSSVHWAVERIRQSTDYEWVRSAMDDMSQDSALSQKERAQIFNAIVQRQNISPLYKEWALTKLPIEDIFHFVVRNQPDGLSRSPHLDDREVFRAGFEMLYTYLFEVSLYNVPGLAPERKQIDQYLASLLQRDEKKYVTAVRLQLLRSQNRRRELLRWRQSPELFRSIGADEDLRLRGPIFLDQPQPPLIDKGQLTGKIAYALNLDKTRYRRDQLAIKDYLTHGNELTQTLTTFAPNFTTALNLPQSPAEIPKEPGLAPLEKASNNADYFALPGTDLTGLWTKLSSPAAKALAYQLAAQNNVVLSEALRDLTEKKDLVGLIHLFNHLPIDRQTIFLSDMESSGLLANEALYRETVTGDKPLDPVWADFFRNFYQAALTHVADPNVRHSILRALVRTYRTEIDLARILYTNDKENVKVMTEEEASQYHRMARYDLRNLVASHLAGEQAQLWKEKANRLSLKEQNPADHAHRTESVMASQDVLEWDIPRAKEDDTSAFQELLSRAELTLQDVHERMTHYENVFKGSSEKLWVAPQIINPRTIGLTIALLSSAILGLIFLRSKSPHRTPNPLAAKRSHNVLELFAQNGAASARSMYKDYRKNKTSFFVWIGFRAIISVLFIYAVSLWELYGIASQLLAIFFGLLIIDLIFNIGLIGTRENLGKYLYDLFPPQFRFKVEQMMHRRETNSDASSVFTDPVRSARKFVDGHLASIYVWEYVLGMISAAIGFLLIHMELGIGYSLFAALFFVLIRYYSSKISSIEDLERKKELLINDWMEKSVMLIQMGFSEEAVSSDLSAVSSAIDLLIKEKMKAMKGLRIFAVALPIMGVLMGLPFTVLAIFRGLEPFYFLPDFLGQRAQSDVAAKSIVSFYNSQLEEKAMDSASNGMKITHLALEHFSLIFLVSLVQDLTHDLRLGELWLISGPNVSGKSTLLQVLAGKNQGTERRGKAILIGHAPDGAQVEIDVRHAENYVHLSAAPSARNERMTLRAYVNSLDLLKNGNRKDEFIRWFGRTKLGDVDLDETLICNLSGAQKVLAQWLFVLMGTDAPIVLLDETLAQLDEPVKKILVDLLKEIAHETGKLIIMAAPQEDHVAYRDVLDGLIELKEGHNHSIAPAMRQAA